MPSIFLRDFVLLILAIIASLYGRAIFVNYAYMQAFDLFEISPLLVHLTGMVASPLVSFLVMFSVGCFLVGSIYHCWLLFVCTYFTMIGIFGLIHIVVAEGAYDKTRLWDPELWSFLVSALPFMYLGRITRKYIGKYIGRQLVGQG